MNSVSTHIYSTAISIPYAPVINWSFAKKLQKDTAFLKKHEARLDL